MSEDRWIPLAEVARAHGVRGELRLRVFNSDSDILLGLDEVLIRFPNGDEHEVSVDAARRASAGRQKNREVNTEPSRPFNRYLRRAESGARASPPAL